MPARGLQSHGVSWAGARLDRPGIFGLDTSLAVYTTIFLILYVSDVILFLSSTSIFSRPIELYVLLMLPILARIHLPDFQQRGLARSFSLWQDHLHVLLPFAGLVMWSLLTSLQSGSALADNSSRTLLILAYRFIMFVSAMSAALLLLRFGWRPLVIGALLTILGSLFYELFNPGTFSNAAGRAAGFPGNPNQAAMILVLLLTLSVRYDRMRPLDLVLILLAFTGVFSTLSRGGMVQFVLFFVNYVYFTGRGRRWRQVLVVPFAVGVMVFVANGVISVLIDSSSMFDAENAQRRLSTLTFEGEAVYETDSSRFGLAGDYLQRIDENVLFGNGTGFSRTLPLGPHNTYLDFWVNNGLIGLILYLWFVFGLTVLSWSRQFWPGFVFMQVALVAGFLTHNLIQFQAFLILAGLTMGISWGIAVTRPAHRQKPAPKPGGVAPRR